MPESNPYESGDQLPDIDLRDPRLAAFLAWLLPGLGHLYQRRTGKGLLFMITILGTFAYGMYLGNGRVVYASTLNPIGEFSRFTDRWHYACQLPIGLPALPAAVQRLRVDSGNPPIDFFEDNFERPPYTLRDLQVFFSPKTEADEAKLNSKYLQTEDSAGNQVFHASEREKWNHDHHLGFDMGTVFTMVAGLMNVLAICDARWGPLVILPDEKGEKDKETKKQTTE